MLSTPINVLLVEDNPDDADILQELLADAGAHDVRIVRAETLRDGLARLARGGLDLVLLDLSLPDSQGLDTVQRALAQPPSLPIVVLTGLDDESLGAAAVQAGAQDYVIKGRADAGVLLRSMRYAVERHRLLADRTEDALVWAALARVGEELMAGVSRHALLDRLCAVTAAVLGCDFTSTWMFDDVADAFVPAAAAPPAEWERIRALRLPRAALQPSGDDPARDGAALYWADDRPSHALPEPLQQLQGGSRAVLYLTLRRGGAIVGTQVCGYRRGGRQWTAAHERIARGLVHLAALALDNARLVEELEQSNTIKTYFAATMSHELRNTLFAIGGFSEMLGESVAHLPGEAPRLTRVIGERARESLQLIQAALELTRSEVRRTADAGEVSLAELLGELAAETDAARQRDGLCIEWQVPDRLPALRTDPLKLKMILKNLLGNAIKFTPVGRVRFAAEVSADAVRFVVADTGIGIDAADLPNLFEPFRQVHGAVSRRAGGAGLGLYIVRRLVELLGGTIGVESAPACGTTITVTLPRDA